MASQNRWSPNVQDSYLSWLTIPLYNELRNGELCENPFDTYSALYIAISAHKDIEEVKYILSYVSELLTKAIEDSEANSKYSQMLNNWRSAWAVYSEFVLLTTENFIKVINFGKRLSEQSDETIETSGCVCSTDCVISPKQINGNFLGSETFEGVSEFDTEILLDFDNKRLYTTEGLDSMDVLSKLQYPNLEWETYYADSDSYNAEDSLTSALDILQEDSPECFKKSPDKFVIIEIGDSRSEEDKKHLFATVESTLAEYFEDYIDEDNELMFAIAENPEFLKNDLSIRVYSATSKKIK